MKKLRIGLLVVAAAVLVGNFILLYQSNWQSIRSGGILMSIAMVCVVVANVLELIRKYRQNK